MRIACISTSKIPSITANSIQVVKACHALAQMGHEVLVYAPGSENIEWKNVESLYGLIEPFSFKNLRSNKIFKRYDFVLKSIFSALFWKADLIYTWTIPAALLAEMIGIPVIIELHDVPVGRFAPTLFRYFLKLKGKKRVLIITQALLERLYLDYDKKQLQGITQISPNGTDLEVYQDLPKGSEARRLLGIPEKFTAVYTGHFYIGRGMNLLFDLAKGFPDINFMWVGGQTETVNYWRSKIQEQNIKNIILTGFISKKELPAYQAAGDVLLMPYEEVIEGSSGGNTVDICSPMKMFDYLAAGRPIVSSDLPVIHEVLSSQNAVFCKPNDVDDWKNAIIELKNNSDLRDKISAQAIKDVKKYTWLKRAENALMGFGEINHK